MRQGRWYLIFPRVSGRLGFRPCRSASEVPQFYFPGTWKEVTRWWYFHRIVGTFVFRVGLTTAGAIVLGEVLDAREASRWLMAGPMLLFAGYGYSALWHSVLQAGNAKAVVGQTVAVERRPGKRRMLPAFWKLPPLAFDGRYYIVDVAIEGVQLVDTEPHEAQELPEPEKFTRYPRSVLLPNADATYSTSKFKGCEGRCSGINWYCIENPRCFHLK